MRLFEGRGVAAVEAGRLVLDDGIAEPFDEALWCTQAAAPAWLRDTGLPLGDACRFPTRHVSQHLPLICLSQDPSWCTVLK